MPDTAELKVLCPDCKGWVGIDLVAGGAIDRLVTDRMLAILATEEGRPLLVTGNTGLTADIRTAQIEQLRRQVKGEPL